MIIPLKIELGKSTIDLENLGFTKVDIYKIINRNIMSYFNATNRIIDSNFECYDIYGKVIFRKHVTKKIIFYFKKYRLYIYKNGMEFYNLKKGISQTIMFPFDETDEFNDSFYKISKKRFGYNALFEKDNNYKIGKIIVESSLPKTRKTHKHMLDLKTKTRLLEKIKKFYILNF